MASLEPLKWLAFALMVVDHVDAIVLHRTQPWMFELGRVVLPLFAVCFGIGLAASRSALDAAGRLAFPMIAAQVAWALAGSSMPNVLCTFFACALCVHVERVSRWPWLWLWLVAAVVAEATGAEGGAFAVLLVSSAYRWARTREPLYLAAGFLAWLVASPFIGAVVGLLLPLVRWPDVSLPRLPFRWLYAAHLLALVALRYLSGGADA